MSKSQKIGLILGPLAFVLILLFVPVQGSLTEAGKKVLAVVAWMVIWWSTNPVPLGAASLLPILLYPLLGLTEEGISATGGFVSSTALLITAIFWLGTAIEQWNLHSRIAFTILSKVGSHPRNLLFGFGFITALLSMWMSNSTACAMMIPVIMALVDSVGKYDKDIARKLGASLMLTVAYCATIGGIATPIGTGTNLTGVGMIMELANVDITFLDWMIFAFPIMIIVVPIMIFVLYNLLGLNKIGQTIDASAIDEELRNLGPMNAGEKTVMVVFGTAMVLWVTRSFWGTALPRVSDLTIGGLAVAALLLIPVDRENDIRALDFNLAVRETSWNTVLLIGGSLTMGSSFTDAGLTEWIADMISGLPQLSELGLVVIFAIICSLMSEISTNLVVAAVFIPVVNSISLQMGVNPVLPMISVILSSSFAFMLPQGTPPSALAFGSGLVTSSEMIKNGAIVKLISLTVMIVLLIIISKIGLIAFY